MVDVRLHYGSMAERQTPDWGPLVAVVGDENAGDFMWMFEVTLDDGRRLQAYKHIFTRGYLHLAADGAAFAYVSPRRYRPVPAADLLAAVLARLGELCGVTEQQLARSWAAVDRLENEERGADG